MTRTQPSGPLCLWQCFRLKTYQQSKMQILMFRRFCIILLDVLHESLALYRNKSVRRSIGGQGEKYGLGVGGRQGDIVNYLQF